MKKRTTSKILALVLCLCVTLGLLPLGGVAIAAETTDIWDGTTAAAFAGGDGSEANPYQIATGAQLAYLSEQSRSEEYEGKHFVLTANLNLNYKAWLPIGTTRNFMGSFDGSGHTVSHFSIPGKQGNTTIYKQGLFGTVRGEYIKNLTISYVNISDAANTSTAFDVGALAGYIFDNTRVENCHVKNVTIHMGVYSAGGLAGSITGVPSTADPVTGGLFGCTAQNITIEPNSEMKAAGNYGGLVGAISAIPEGHTYTLENCFASGSISTTVNEGWNGSGWGGIGGLVGAMIGGSYDSGTGTATKERDYMVRNCHADVTVTAPHLSGVGGLFGEASILTMENCSASGNVTGAWEVGGLVGTGTASELRGCHATGDVTATDWHVGGLVGYGSKSTLDRCFATGNVKTSATWDSRIGGLLGNAYGSIATDCFAAGDVEGQRYVGGLAGWTSLNNTTSGANFTNCFAFGRVHDRESEDNSYSVPLVYGTWLENVNLSNCFYSEERSGATEGKTSPAINKTPAEFADGTVLELLGGNFVQIENAACPTLPVEWSGYPKSFEEGIYYRISEGKSWRSDVEAGFDRVTLPASSTLEVLGVWEIGRRQTVDIHGQVPCGDSGKVVMTTGKTLSVLNVYGSIGKLEALGGATVFYSGSEIGKATVNLPFNENINAYDQLNSNGAVGELILQSGMYLNHNNATIKKAAVLGGELSNSYLRYKGFENMPNPPVIDKVEVKGGSLYQNNLSDAANEGMPYENPARIKTLTMDMRYPDSRVYNYFGGTIEEAMLDGKNVQADDLENTATFDNYKGGVVNKLTIEGDAGYHIYNRNDTEYGTPVVEKVTTDGGYCKIYNDNGGLIKKATIWYYSELVNNRRAVVKNAFIHESNVRNTFHNTSNTGGLIEKLYTTDASSIKNWAPARIWEIYADRSEGSSLFISDVTEKDPNAEGGTVDRVYYRLQPDKGAPGTFTFDDNTILISDEGEAFNGTYGLSDAQVGFQFNYTGGGKLTGVQMNGTEMAFGTDGNYSFTMPHQNAVLSVSDRALKIDATLKSLTYSVNGGEPVPVPEFTASNGSYFISLPRETPRDATVTLAGVPTDADAEITASADGKLVYGATEYEAPASLTVTAEDRTEKTYKVFFYTQPVQADMQDAVIGGIENGDTFIQNQMPSFTAAGSGLENDNPAVDDERCRPASWKIDDGSVLSGSWDGAPFSGSLDVSQLSKGIHTLAVTYNWERFGELYENDEPTGEYGWVVITPDGPENLTKTVSFTVNPVTYALTVENGTDKTGGSPYEAGVEVSLAADEAPAGYVFDKWVLTSGEGTFADASKAETTFTMGEGDATVTAAYKDAEAPTGEITIAANGWKEFLHTITFGLFYKEKQDVNITAQDTSGEAVKIVYFLSAEALTLDEVQGETQGWAAYTGKFSVDPDKEFIVYARLTDAAGNVTYLSSDGVVLDATPPVIAGIEDGKTYTQAKSVTVTDAYLSEVKLNGEEQKIDGGKSGFTLTKNGSYTVTAKDKAGNEAAATVTIDIPPETYVLTFDADGGLPVPQAQTLEAGEKPAAVANPAKEGYTFLGWYNDDGEKVDLSTFTMSETNVMLTARWEKNVIPDPTNPTEPTGPTKPTNPKNPSDPTDPSHPANPSDTPQTGDDFPAWPLWLALLSLCGIGGSLLIARRRKARMK